MWLAYSPVDDRWFVTHEYYKEGGALISEHAAKIKGVPGEITSDVVRPRRTRQVAGSWGSTAST